MNIDYWLLELQVLPLLEPRPASARLPWPGSKARSKEQGILACCYTITSCTMTKASRDQHLPFLLVVNREYRPNLRIFTRRALGRSSTQHTGTMANEPRGVSTVH